MKIKHILVAISLVGSFTVFSQQIGDGHASTNYPANFSLPLLSGIYNGYNPLGSNSDTSHPFQHLFVARHSKQENNYQLQISSSFSVNDRLFFRKLVNGGLESNNQVWHEIATRGTNVFTGQQEIIGNLALGGTQPNSNINFESQPGFHRIAFHELRFWDWEHGETMTINNGNVGIGTTTPEGKLDINANGNIPVIRGNGGYIPTGLRFVDDSYSAKGEIKEWAIWKGNTWLKGLGFMRYDAVDRCATGICSLSRWRKLVYKGSSLAQAFACARNSEQTF